MNTNDITAGSKYNLNTAGIDFTLGVRVLELYMNNTTNLIQGTPPILYSIKDFIQFFVAMEISGSLIQDTPGNWLFSSPNDMTTRAVTYFMAFEFNGNILHITADGNVPTVYSASSGNNFVSKVNLAAHPGFGLSFKVLIDGQSVFLGPMPNSVTDNNTFLTWLNTTYPQYGVWTKTYTNYQTNYVLSSTEAHTVSILLGSQAAALLTINVATSQTITFPNFSAMAHTAAPFTLPAYSSSGLPLTYVSGTPSVASISGNIVTPLTAGSTVITASQAGNVDYAAATPVAKTLTLS